MEFPENSVFFTDVFFTERRVLPEFSGLSAHRVLEFYVKHKSCNQCG
jgi:hypothetical protein